MQSKKELKMPYCDYKYVNYTNPKKDTNTPYYKVEIVNDTTSESKNKCYLIKDGKEIELTEEYCKELRLEKERVWKERVEKAIKENEICCITHDVLTKDNICISICGHAFSIEGATSIIERKINECPICRECLYL